MRHVAPFFTRLLIAALLPAGHSATAAPSAPPTDSLRRLLRTAQPDTSRVLTLMELSFAHRGDKPDTAIQLAREGVQLARRIGFRRGEAECLNSQGLAYLTLDDRPRAMQALRAALHLNEAIGNRWGAAANLANIAQVYDLQGDARTAIRYALRAKTHATALRRETDVTLLLFNIGGSYAELGRLDSAFLYTRRGYERARRGHDVQNLVVANVNLGTMELRAGRPALALRHYRRALPLCRRMGYAEYLSSNYLSIAELLAAHPHLTSQTAPTDSVLHYARLALLTARRHRLAGPTLAAATVLADRFRSRHHAPDSVVRYLDLTAVARDSLYNQEKLTSVQRLLFAENIRQQERRAAEVQAEAARLYNLQLLAIAIFILSGITLLLLFSRRLSRSRAAGILGLVALLMVFEFANLLAGPTIDRLTNNSPVLALLVMVAVAAGLAPLHHRLERWVKGRFAAEKV